MFPMPMPEIPQEVIDLVSANPEGFADAMGSGMEAMGAAMANGASPAEAFGAMGDVMGPIMEDLGMSPDMFDAMGDMVGAAVGPAMHMAPADADGGDMGAMMQDGIDMMMPPGMEVPAPIMEAMGDMGQAMGDAGMGCHDVGAEMMGDPGSDTYMLPTDANGGPVVEPGQPETCPAEACQAPPMDGACASTDGMMPPEGGYDHAPMGDNVMSEPFDVAAVIDLIQTDGSAPAVDDGGQQALEEAIGDSHEIIEAIQDGPTQDDIAVGAAMDGATEQGGGVGSGASMVQDFGDTGDSEEANDSQDVDPSAGLG